MVKIFLCHICVKCHKTDTLSRIPPNPYYGSLVGAYFGLLSKFSSFVSLFCTLFNLSTKCVGGTLYHGSLISYKLVLKNSHSNKPEFTGHWPPDGPSNSVSKTRSVSTFQIFCVCLVGSNVTQMSRVTIQCDVIPHQRNMWALIQV